MHASRDGLSPQGVDGTTPAGGLYQVNNLSESQTQELVRADIMQPDPMPGKDHLGRFTPGNQLYGRRGKQRIASEIFNRALEVMQGAPPEPLDEKNCLVHLIRDMTDITLDRELRQKAAMGICKFVIG